MSTKNEENDLSVLRHCLSGQAFAWEEFVDRFVILVLRVIEATAQGQKRTLDEIQISDLGEAVFRSFRYNHFQLLREFEGKATVVTYIMLLTRRLTCAFLEQMDQRPDNVPKSR